MSWRSVCATAISADPLLCSRLLETMRQNFSFKKQSRFTLAAQEHSTSELRNQGLPPVVRLLLFLPALRLFPGQSPAQELRCLTDGNGVISPPVSARIAAALVSRIAGTVCSNCHCGSSRA